MQRRTFSTRLLVFAWVALASGVPARSTWAGDDAAADKAAADKAVAEAILRRGAAALESGSYANALAAFEQACNLFPSPQIFFNIGLAHTRLGNDAEALRAFDRFVASRAGAPEHVADAQRLSATLRTKVATIKITGAEADTELSVDDRLWGKYPADAVVYVEPGRHRLAAHKPPATTVVTQEIMAVPGQTATVRLAPAVPVLKAPEPETSSGDGHELLSGRGTGDQHRGEPPTRNPWLPWVIGGAVVVVAGGVAGWLVTHPSTEYPVPTDRGKFPQ